MVERLCIHSMWLQVIFENALWLQPSVSHFASQTRPHTLSLGCTVPFQMFFADVRVHSARPPFPLPLPMAAHVTSTALRCSCRVVLCVRLAERHTCVNVDGNAADVLGGCIPCDTAAILYRSTSLRCGPPRSISAFDRLHVSAALCICVCLPVCMCMLLT